jgi:dihydrofolate reductase
VRRIVFAMSVSLDGFMSGPRGELDWHRVNEEVHEHFNEQLAAMSAFLDGRVTYELMASYWPTADQDPDAPGPVRDFARIWRDMPKLVFSRTLDRADWGSTVVRDVVPAEVARLKEQSGGDMAVGGARLAASFLALGLVDELRLYLTPVVLGAGQPMFRTPVPDLDLQETRRFGNGVVLLRYAVQPAESRRLPLARSAWQSRRKTR